MTLDQLITGTCAAVGGGVTQLFVNRRLRKFLQHHLDFIYRRMGRVDAALNQTPVPVPDTDPDSVLREFQTTNHGHIPKKPSP